MGKGGGATVSASDASGAEGRAGRAGELTRRFRFALMGIYIVPMLVIAYIFIAYIYPMFTATGNEVLALGVSAVLTFAVVVSVLGMLLLSRSATDNMVNLKNLNERMDKLLGMTSRFGQTGYMDTVLDSIAKSSAEVLNAETSSLLLYDEDGDLRFEYVEGPVSVKLKGKKVKPGEGITGWAAQEKRAVIINDVQSDSRYNRRFDEDSGFVTRSILCVPLRFSGQDLGVLEVLNKRGNEGFNEQDEKVLESLADHAAVAIHRNLALEDTKSDFIHLLDILVTAMDNHMPEKKGHSRRVSYYSVKLAKALGLNEDEVKKVYFGGLLHDIGLLRFDPAVYKDKDKLKLHPAVGAEMIRNIRQWKDVQEIVRDHHERYDGGGYPHGQAGPDISLGGRILALAEAFDVMTSKNSYRERMSFEEASREIKANSGSQFDPRVAEVFFASFTVEDITEV